jgi:hypothetical protein
VVRIAPRNVSSAESARSERGMFGWLRAMVGR